MGTVTLSASLVARPGARRELAQALLDWVAAARRAAGIVRSSVCEDIEAEAAFELIAEWETPAALGIHVSSESFGILLGAMSVLADPVRMSVTRAADEYGTDALWALKRLREAR